MGDRLPLYYSPETLRLHYIQLLPLSKELDGLGDSQAILRAFSESFGKVSGGVSGRSGLVTCLCSVEKSLLFFYLSHQQKLASFMLRPASFIVSLQLGGVKDMPSWEELPVVDVYGLVFSPAEPRNKESDRLVAAFMEYRREKSSFVLISRYSKEYFTSLYPMTFAYLQSILRGFEVAVTLQSPYSQRQPSFQSVRQEVAMTQGGVVASQWTPKKAPVSKSVYKEETL